MSSQKAAVLLLALLLVLLACSNAQQPVVEVGKAFKAYGNKDPDHRPERRKVGEVVVTFDRLPAKMSFNMPSFPCLVTENGISYYNGWTETYDDAAGVGSCEPLMDQDNVHSRMWIESQNDARIVIRWRAALVSSKGIIAHNDEPQVAPYGPGDWVDEKYIIYPDGIHVRHSTIYTYFAPEAKPFGWDRDPPNYIFEFQEMLFYGYGRPGYLPEDDIETDALTLIQLSGAHTTISYDPYPIHFEPEEDDLYAAFGDFRDANIFVANTKSEYRPFTIGRPEGVSLSPYAPERETRRGIFQSWPQEPVRGEGYDGAALGHMVLRTFYNKTETTISQVYLSGFTNATEPEKTLAPLGRSWLWPPALKIAPGNRGKSYGYDLSQRAYLIEAEPTQTGIVFDIAASDVNPLYNPVFLVNRWGKRDAVLEVNGAVVEKGADYRIGYYEILELGDGRTWQDVLVVWVLGKSIKPATLTLSKVD
jgi:hypothetical protein